MKKNQKISAVLCAMACVLAGIGGFQYLREKDAGSGYEKVRAEVKQEKSGSEAQTEPHTTKKGKRSQETESLQETKSEETETKHKVEVPIDFEALWKENPEAYAWIKIPGTEIDYPILQSETDNTYYLTHTIDGKESPEGAIFTEDYNTKDFQDANTVVYGHNMKNGTMFQNLHNYMDKAFFDENREIFIYLPDQILRYEIFAAYLYDNRHLLQSFDFEDPDIFQAYLDQIFSMRGMDTFVDRSMEVTAKDKILTLSTCYAGISTQRYLVQAVLVSIEQSF